MPSSKQPKRKPTKVENWYGYRAPLPGSDWRADYVYPPTIAKDQAKEEKKLTPYQKALAMRTPVTSFTGGLPFTPFIPTASNPNARPAPKPAAPVSSTYSAGSRYGSADAAEHALTPQSLSPLPPITAPPVGALAGPAVAPVQAAAPLPPRPVYPTLNIDPIRAAALANLAGADSDYVTRKNAAQSGMADITAQSAAATGRLVDGSPGMDPAFAAMLRQYDSSTAGSNKSYVLGMDVEGAGATRDAKYSLESALAALAARDAQDKAKFEYGIQADDYSHARDLADANSTHARDRAEALADYDRKLNDTRTDPAYLLGLAKDAASIASSGTKATGNQPYSGETKSQIKFRDDAFMAEVFRRIDTHAMTPEQAKTEITAMAAGKLMPDQITTLISAIDDHATERADQEQADSKYQQNLPAGVTASPTQILRALGLG